MKRKFELTKRGKYVGKRLVMTPEEEIMVEILKYPWMTRDGFQPPARPYYAVLAGLMGYETIVVFEGHYFDGEGIPLRYPSDYDIIRAWYWYTGQLLQYNAVNCIAKSGHEEPVWRIKRASTIPLTDSLRRASFSGWHVRDNFVD